MTTLTVVPLQAVASVPSVQASRVKRDRLELLTALINGPRFDPLLRPDLMTLPRDHAVFGWACRVAGCLRSRVDHRDLCGSHQDELKAVTQAGGGRAEFLRAARPLEASDYVEVPSCRICPERPAHNFRLGLCHRHSQAWLTVQREDPMTGFETWLAGRPPLPGFGGCAVPICEALAASAAGLCSGHYNRYRHVAAAARGRGRNRPVEPDDAPRFQAWCRTADPIWRPGLLNLNGLTSLVANAARRVHTDKLLSAVREALRRMRRDGTRVTVRGVARLSGASRTFLYQNNDARRLIADAVTSTGEQRAAVRAAQHGSSQVAASWRERALNAEDQLRKTHREIHTLRAHVGELMGQLDQLTTARVEDNIQTVNSANTELRQQIRQLNANCRQLEDKLAAARSNNRFLDKRVAALEAQLLEQAPTATRRR